MVIAAVCQPLAMSPLKIVRSAPAAEMKHLRIKLVGKLNELLLRHGQRLGFEPVTHFQIIEVAFVHNGESQSRLMRQTHLSNIKCFAVAA